MNRCRSCAAPIEWAETVKGRPMPLDIPGLPGAPVGNLAVIGHIGDVKVVAYVPPEIRALLRDDVLSALRVSHFATCPDAAAHRRRQGDHDE